MFTRIIKVDGKFRVKTGLLAPTYLDSSDFDFWWYSESYVHKNCNFDSVEDAEKGYAIYKNIAKEERLKNKSYFIKFLK